MKRSPDFTTIMTECPLEHHTEFPMLKEEPTRDFASRHAQLSLKSKRVLDRLLVLLPSHLKSHPTSRISPFPPALLYSICDALHPESSAEQNDPSVLTSVLSRLRKWRLLESDYRYSPGGIHKLALDLAGTTDEASASSSPDLNHISHARLRMKWVGSDSSSESPDRESSLPTPPPPSPSRSDALDSAQECAHVLPDLKGRRPDVGYESYQVGRLGTPDSEDTLNVVVSPRLRSMSGFRSGCSACRHLRLSGYSAPASPSRHTASMPFSDVNQFYMNINPNVPASPNHPKPNARHATPKKTKRNKLKSLQSVPCGAHVNENEPPLPKSMGIQQGIGILFPRQRTHTPGKSNTLSSREPFSPVTASVQRRPEPNQARQGDKHTVSQRVASVDRGLSMVKPCSTRASPNDLHPLAPMRASSISYSPGNSHGVGGVGAGVQKLSSNAVGSLSSKRIPSWSRTHLVCPRSSTTTFVTPTGSPPAKARLWNPHLRPSGAPSRRSSTSTPRSVPSDMDMKRRDHPLVPSQTHKHTSSDGVLPLLPLIHARRWQV